MTSLGMLLFNSLGFDRLPFVCSAPTLGKAGREAEEDFGEDAIYLSPSFLPTTPMILRVHVNQVA